MRRGFTMAVLALGVGIAAMAAEPAITTFGASGGLVWAQSFAHGEASVECCTNLATGCWLPVQRVFTPGSAWTGPVAVVEETPVFYRIAATDYDQPRCWAEYAFWFDHSGVTYFATNDVFMGKVHSGEPIYLYGAPVFHQIVSSSASNWGAWSASAVFEKGYQLGAPIESLASINFTNTESSQDCLWLQADLIVTGATSIAMSGTNLYISNAGRVWVKYNYGAGHGAMMTNGLLYVATVGMSTGTVNLAGTLDGRLTIVADGTINITNHIRYASQPATNASSDDVLGLISRQDIIVTKSCPSNLDLHAHMIATGDLTGSTHGGMFTVEDYHIRPQQACGNLQVYGGIVQNYLGPIGATGGHGYVKQYRYDTRLPSNPPPRYPSIVYAHP